MFSNRQKRGGLYLLLLLLVVVLCVDMTKRRIAERVAVVESQEVAATPADSTYLFDFDPNSATLQDFRRLGLDKAIAVSIIRWRSSGKVFRIKEDLAEAYNLPDSVYYAIEPYIKIAAQYGYEKRAKKEYTPNRPQTKRQLTPLAPFTLDTVSANYLHSTGLFSLRQANTFVNFRNSGGMKDMEGVRYCFVVSDSIAELLERYIIFPATKAEFKIVDINKADSSELRSVRGIGEKSVVAILEYRKKLGGFYSVDQLSELKVVSESNFERIIQQISCDSCDISKIDVNFAVAKKFIGHPYITDKAVRRLLKTREIKGGWSNIVEMTKDNIFTLEEAAKLRPYLWFDNYTPPSK